MPFGAPTPATWVKHAGDDHGQNYGLVTTSQPDSMQPNGVSYGGAELSGSALPTTEPKLITALSYDFNPAQAGASGGSPRMVVCFDDAANCANNADLGPNTWTPGWATVNGFAGGANSVWVNNGGCGYEYNTTWSNIVACQSDAPISEIFVVNDSGWVTSSSETITLDNLDVNGVIATGP